MTTITRRMYSGTGWPLSNGAGVPITFSITSDSLEQAIYDLLAELRAAVGGPSSNIFQDLQAWGASLADQIRAALGIPAGGYVGLIPRVEDIYEATVDPATILTAIQNVRHDTAEPHLPTLKDVLDQLDLGVPATSLPSPAPEGYGGAAAQDVATAVWAYTLWAADAILGNYQTTAGAVLQYASWPASIRAYTEGVVDSRNPYFALVGRNAGVIANLGFGGWQLYNVAPVPELDFAAVVPGETLLSFLQREVPSLTWTATGPYGSASPAGVYAQASVNPQNLWWRCLLTTEQLHLLAGQLWPAGLLPPVWPGLDNVTLAEPVPFSDIMEIQGPMDGVLVEYTTPPSHVDKWTVEDYTNYGHAGQIAFTSDNGYAESWQYLQWDKQVYVPRALSVAASVLLRPIAGQEGTVTPWTRN